MQMDQELPIRQPSLADQVYEIIVKGISNGSYPPGSLLPSENQLAERYNVSRPTIRAAFARLVERGFVKRQRGVGTFVAESPSIVNPLYQLLDVHERISARGFAPGFVQIRSEIIEAEQDIAEKLSVEVGSSILHIHKVFTADDEPIIMFVNYIPGGVFQECLTIEQALEPGVTEPFFEFFAQQCNTNVKYLTSVITPEVAKNCQLPDLFKFDDPHTPILVIEDIGYDENDSPVFLSMEYLVGDASSFHVIRHVENF
ncbi:MAG: GntR family transcriptional regulator [Anaerolineales bacterium]|nr:GntR family transcriptional regulator [Chloroflexota bacterium]MBL6982056.1 GntR family transcriptional regulator [Anaerolineales bacterium]